MESSSKKRKSYTIKEKLEAIERVKSGVSATQVARDLGILFCPIPPPNVHVYELKEKRMDEH